MAQLFANNAYGSLGSSLSNVATSLTLATGNGARFPSPSGGDYFLATLVGLDGNGAENAWEIVKVTARSTDTLTIVRAQESTSAVAWASGTRIEVRGTAGTFGNLAPLATPTFSGAIKGDFSNATASSRVSFQTSTTNGSTIASAKPDGTGAASYFQAFNASAVDNAGYVYVGITSTTAQINSSKTGSGTTLPIIFAIDASEKMRLATDGNFGIGTVPNTGQGVLQAFRTGVTGGGPAASGNTDANQLGWIGGGSVGTMFGAYANGDGWIQQRSLTNFATNYGLGINPNGGRVFIGGGLQQTKVAMAANAIDLSLANVFTKTFTAGAVSLTVSNVPTTGTAATFVLEATNAGLATITWPTGSKWAGGTAPTLTSSGVDVIGGYSHDGGTAWRLFVLAKDSK